MNNDERNGYVCLNSHREVIAYTEFIINLCEFDTTILFCC